MTRRKETSRWKCQVDLWPFLCVWARRQPAARQRSCPLCESGTRPGVVTESVRAGTHSDPWTHQLPEEWKHNTDIYIHVTSRKTNRCSKTSKYLSWHLNTHVCVLIVEFHYNIGRAGHCDLRVAKNLHFIEDERLVPGGIESVSHRHRLLGLVEEGYDRVGVWREKNTVTLSSLNLVSREYIRFEVWPFGRVRSFILTKIFSIFGYSTYTVSFTYDRYNVIDVLDLIIKRIFCMTVPSIHPLSIHLSGPKRIPILEGKPIAPSSSHFLPLWTFTGRIRSAIPLELEHNLRSFSFKKLPPPPPL